MPPSNIVWPTPSEYDSALQNRRTTFYDADIQQGTLHERAGRPARLNGGGSRYVIVYRVGNWVVRCFTSEPPNVSPPADIQQRYRAITAYLNRFRSSPDLAFLVPHIWIERGINMGGETFPFLKVPFIQGGQPLGDFLSDHHSDHRAMDLLAQRWFDVVEQLEARQIAHGDLDMTNVLVCGTFPNLSLKLIDFDGMYVPDLAPYHLDVTDAGHNHFQSTLPGIRTFGPQMDRFSVLIIYITLIALTTNDALWENCDADESRPLLKREDFDRLGLSKNYIRLLNERNNKDLQKCLQELEASIIQRRMPRSLPEIVNRSRPLYAVQDAPPSSSYEGRALPIPEGPASGPMRTPPRSRPLDTGTGAGISTGTGTGPRMIPTPIPPTPTPVPDEEARKRQRRIVTAIIIVAIVVVVLLIIAAANHGILMLPTGAPVFRSFVAVQALVLLPKGDIEGDIDG